METQRKAMNLLYLFTDQHSREVYGHYGNPYVHTPNLDRLAASGTTFRNAYCNNPICVPSRASQAIGDYCFKYSYWDNAHPYKGDQEGWGHRLTQQGIDVTTIGKLHYAGNFPETGFPDQRIPLNCKDGIGDVVHNIRDGSVSRSFFGEAIRNAGVGDSDYLHYDTKVALLTEQFLMEKAKNPSDKPWCLFVGFACPHYPWVVPKEILDLYAPFDKLPYPKQWTKDERPTHPEYEFFRKEFDYGELTDEQLMQGKAAYYGTVTFMDLQVGRVIKALELSGLADSTRIIYTSDHGNLCGEHGLWFKHNMYEGSVGVPMVMAGPDVPAGKFVDTDVSLVDIFPTVLDCTGAHPEAEDAEKPGRSLLDVIEQEDANGPDTNRVTFADYFTLGSYRASYMLKKNGCKLIYFVDDKAQLFDLNKDPEELHDLIDDPAYQEIRKDLEAELRKICDPEAMDAQSRADQQAMLDAHGGIEKVRHMTSPWFSAVPADGK